MQSSPVSDKLDWIFRSDERLDCVFRTGSHPVGIDVLSSRDTEEHVEQVLNDADFRFNHLLASVATVPLSELDYAIDGVSGATLTSRTIQQAIVSRLGGERIQGRSNSTTTSNWKTCASSSRTPNT